MKRNLLAVLSLVLISAMTFSLCACDKEPQTDEPGTEQPGTSVDTSGDKVDKVTQENVAELFLPSLECYVSYMGSAFYTVERDENGILKKYDIKDPYDGFDIQAYKVIEYDNFEPIKEQMRKYLSERVYLSLLFERGVYIEQDGDLFIEDTNINVDEYYDITSIKLLESDGDKYKISVYEGFTGAGDEIRYVYENVFTTVLKDGALVIESIETNNANDFDKESVDCKWIGVLYNLYGEDPRPLPLNVIKFE